MEQLWIALSVLAALCQAVRTAAQRTLNRRMSTLATTYVRSLFGFPLLALNLAALMVVTGEAMPRVHTAYLGWTLLGAAAQVLATLALMRMLQLRSFAVGTMLTKVDVVMTAILGAALFSEQITLAGAAGLAIVTVGVVLMSAGRAGLSGAAASPGTLAGLRPVLLPGPVVVTALSCAFLFTLSYLFLREATLAIDGSFLMRGALTVALATLLQVIIVGAWLARAEPKAFAQFWPERGIATFIGATSALGSIGWFTAFALQNASYVRAVGQIEVVFTLVISAAYFRERLTAMEVIGIVVTVLGVVVFRIAP